MAEVTREVVHDRKGGSGLLTWLALLLSIAALVLAWIAYNRTGEDLENQAAEETSEVLNEGAEQLDEATTEDTNEGTTDTQNQ